MNNPEMYEKFASYQKRDADHCLERFKNKMNWKKNAKIIDVGSGDGSATQNILKKHAPADFSELIGIDIGDKMVEYANKKYGDDKTKFQLMNMREDIPEEFEERFDHAFSSYVFHFLPDQEKAFKNIRDLLKIGGTCAIVFNGRHPMYNIFIALSNQDKWQNYMQTIDEFVPRYHYLNEEGTEKEIKRIVKDIGCINVKVHCEEMSYVFENLEQFMNMVKSANPFKIPDTMLNHWIDDLKKLAIETKRFKKVKENSDEVCLKYDRIEFFGQK